MRPSKRPSWILYVLLRHRWFIVVSLLVVMVPTIVVTYLLEEKFTVTTTIMPPETQTSPGLSLGGLGLSEFAGFFSGGMGFSLPLMTTMSDVYEEILNSRTLVESVILSTGYLQEVEEYERYMQNPQLGLYWARKKFRENYEARVTPSGFIEIAVTTGDPWYSVEVSERVVEVLDSINTSVNVSRARETREFLEMRYGTAESLLAVAQDELREFEEEHGIVALDQEMEAFIGTLAELKQSYMELRAQAQAIRRGISGGTSATALLREREAEALLDVIGMLETGDVPPGYEEVVPAVPMDELPEVTFQYARLRADYEMLLEMTGITRLTLQQAMLEEEREPVPIRVLDPPRHPGWKSKPKKLYIWIEVFLLALLGVAGFLFARENFARMREERPEDWKRWNDLLRDIGDDLRLRRRSRRSRD